MSVQFPVPSDSVLARIQSDLTYSPSTGAIRWVNPCAPSRIEAGDIAGFIGADGYRIITLRVDEHPWPVKLRGHRVAWFLQTGRWPAFNIDHKNRDRSDNTWSNLRRSTPLIEKVNQGLRHDNPSGTRGVTLRRDTNRWTAAITYDYVAYHLGVFDTFEEAREARYAAERLWYGRLCASSDGRSAA